MNGSSALLRSVEPVLRSRCSRIPHLQAHILSQRTCSTQASNRHGPHKVKLRLQSSHCISRSQSTLSAWDPSILQPTNESNVSYANEPQQDDRHKPELASSVELEPADERSTNAASRTELRQAESEINQLIEEGQPEPILHWLLDPLLGWRFIAHADDAAFSRAFCLLDPSYFVEPLKPIFRSLKTSMHSKPRYRRIRSMEERLESLTQAIDRIIRTRRRAGHKLQLEVYEHILRWAEVMGDGRLADTVFNETMQQDAVEPSLACYNYHIGATVMAGRYETQQKFLDRLTPFNQRLRTELAKGDRLPPNDFQPPMAGIRPFRQSPATIREAALKSFKAVTGKGLSADEHTFTNLMLAMSQNGDLIGVKSVLRSVWNINVDLLAQFDEEEVESPTFYDEGHPLRPSGRLLWAIAHSFGNNNEMYAATSIVDYVARNYNLTVPFEVWMHLYELTFVLSRPDNKRSRRQSGGFAVGQLDADALSRFFNVLIDEPHNIEPTVEMFIMRANIQRQRHILDSTLELMRDSMAILETQVTELSKVYDEMRSAIYHWTSGKDIQDIRLPASFYKTRRDFLLRYFRCQASLQSIMVSMRNVMLETEWPGTGGQAEWCSRLLPNMIEEFPTFLPDKLDYDTKTGHVILENGHAHRWFAIQSANDHFHVKAGMLARALDTEDYETMIKSMKFTNHKLNIYEGRCTLCEPGNHSIRDCPQKDLILAGLKDLPRSRDDGPITARSKATSLRKSQEWSPMKAEDVPFSRESFSKYFDGEDERPDLPIRRTVGTSTWSESRNGEGTPNQHEDIDQVQDSFGDGMLEVAEGVHPDSSPPSSRSQHHQG